MTRRVSAWAMLLAIIAALTLLPATPAAAAPFDCKDAPVPTQPSLAGPAAMGAHAAQEPTGTDPFAVGATTTVYREYGWPTKWWPTYDLGCGPDVARNPDGVFGSMIANFGGMTTLVYATTFDALTHAVLDWKGLDPVDGALAGVVDDLREDIWVPLITVMVLLTAGWFLTAIIRGSHGPALKAAGLTIVASFALVIVLNYPQKSAQVFDSTVQGAVAVSYSGTVPGADSGAEIGDAIVSQVFQVTMYDRWCEGIIGGSPQNAEWCPRLWKSLYLSRTEAALTGDAKHTLIEKKRDDFEAVAEEIKDKDPAAYSALTGAESQGRIFSVSAALVMWPVVTVYPLMSMFMLLTALMLLRVAVMFAPILGPLLIHPTTRRMCRPALHVIGGALLNALLFGVASALFLRVEVAVMAFTSLSLVVRLLILFVLMFAFWLLTKPFRRIRQMRPRKAGQSDDEDKKQTESVFSRMFHRQPATPAPPPAYHPPPPAEAGNRR